MIVGVRPSSIHLPPLRAAFLPRGNRIFVQIALLTFFFLLTFLNFSSTSWMAIASSARPTSKPTRRRRAQHRRRPPIVLVSWPHRNPPFDATRLVES